MRAAWVVGLLVARAAVADPYPVDYVDRPLLLFDGMTELDAHVFEARMSYDATDANGAPVSLPSRTMVDIGGSVRHQFGDLELSGGGATNVRSGQAQDYNSIYAGARLKLGSLQHAFALSGSYTPAQQALVHGYSLGAAFEAKARAPKRAFALFWDVGVSGHQESKVSGPSDRVAIFAIGTAEFQIVHHLAFTLSGGLSVALHHTGDLGGEVAPVAAAPSLQLTFEHFDVYAALYGLGFVDVDEQTHWLWAGAVGVRARL